MNLLVFRVNQLQKVSVMHFRIAILRLFYDARFYCADMWLKKKNSRHFPSVGHTI